MNNTFRIGDFACSHVLKIAWQAAKSDAKGGTMSPTPCIDLGMSLLIFSATTMRSSQTFRSNYPNKFCKSVVHSRMLCRVLVRIKDIGPCQGKMPRMCKTGSLILKVQPMHEVGANKKICKHSQINPTVWMRFRFSCTCPMMDWVIRMSESSETTSTQLIVETNLTCRTNIDGTKISQETRIHHLKQGHFIRFIP